MSHIRMTSTISRRKLLTLVGASAVVSALPRVSRAQNKVMHIALGGASDIQCKVQVAAQLLRKHYGYDVKISLLQVAVQYAALNKGEVDVMAGAYLEGDGPLKGEFKGGHANFITPIANQIIVIAKSEGPMDQGLVVPAYVDVKTMDDLKANRDKFGGKILGGDPAWGLSQAADRAIKAYNLDFNLVLSSEEAMIAGLKRAYARKEWICITGWRVHPMWVQFDLKYVEDPKKVFGSEPFWSYTVGHKGFDTKFPEAYKFFQKFFIPNDELSTLMLWNANGMDADAVAKKWIEQTEGKGIIEAWFR